VLPLTAMTAADAAVCLTKLAQTLDPCARLEDFVTTSDMFPTMAGDRPAQ
jgi:hypothetical protein